MLNSTIKSLILLATSLTLALSCGIQQEVSYDKRNRNLKKSSTSLSTASIKMISHVQKSAKNSMGLCWTYVQRAFNVSRNLPIRQISLPGNGPDNITRLQKKGFCKSKTGSLSKAPVGSILIYNPGVCGAHSKYGHGEIKVNSTKFCSDFCWDSSKLRGFAKTSCTTASAVLIPVELESDYCE